MTTVFYLINDENWDYGKQETVNLFTFYHEPNKGHSGHENSTIRVLPNLYNLDRFNRNICYHHKLH